MATYQDDVQIRIAKPEKYSGAHGGLKTWLLMMNICFRTQAKMLPDEVSKILFAVSYLEGAALSRVQPRIDDFLMNDKEDWEEETGQIFHSFKNFCVVLCEAFSSQEENRTNERELLTLRQRQAASVYAARFRTLANTIEWDEGAQASHFYEGLNDRVKDAMVAVQTPDTLAGMIDTAVKMDNRQYERYVDKTSSATSGPRKKRQLRGDPMNSMQ